MEDVAKESSTHTIGTYCVMVPEELIYALGGMPVKLCSGSYTAFQIGDDFAPRDACPLVKAIMGYKDMGTVSMYENCSMMVVPITCDCKKKLAGFLSEDYKTYPLYVPTKRDSDDDMEQFTRELYNLAFEISKVTGKELSYQNLKSACQMVMKSQYELSRFIELKRKYPLVIKGTHAMAVMNSYSYMHTQNWCKNLKALNDELSQNASQNIMASRENFPRIIVTGSPIAFPNMKIPLLIEEMGGAIVADETCMGERGLYDPLAIVDETIDGIMRAFANRSTRPCTCPSFIDNDRRIYRLKQMIKEYKVEGIIYHVLRGCLVYDYEVNALEKALGIPVLRVETDYNEEDIEQLRIRIEAFIELIKYGGGK